jgi:alpha-mannosidase
MVLMPNPGPWQESGVVRAAEELVTPPLLIYQGIHPGTMEQSQSFLSVDVPDVVVSAIKMAEEGKGVIVRMYETAGRETHAKLDLHFAHAHWSGTLHPFEIKTLRIDPEIGEATEVNLLEEEVRNKN